MLIGIHVRVAGGYGAALAHAKAAGCSAIQIFSSNPRSYRTSAPDIAALEKFAQMRRDAGIQMSAIHTPYLVNLASDDPKVAAGSLRLLEADLTVAKHSGIDYVNTHLGSYGKRDRNEGFAAICNALQQALEFTTPETYLVMENSAGAGALAGGTLEELGSLVKAVDHPQLGVCLDTAHAWAAGYEINSQAGVDAFLEQADRHIGMDRIKMFHFNDTEIPLGGNRDRHWHIGEGLIGFEGFRALLSRPELSDKMAILETPGEDADDIRNMQTVLAIARGAAAKV